MTAQTLLDPWIEPSDSADYAGQTVEYILRSLERDGVRILWQNIDKDLLNQVWEGRE